MTALQCSMEAANAYFNILNQSISLSFSDANFACSIRHPDDDISVFTTTKATTTKTTFSDYTTRGGRPKEKRSISSATDTPAATRWCFYVIAVLLLHVTSNF